MSGYSVGVVESANSNIEYIVDMEPPQQTLFSLKLFEQFDIETTKKQHVILHTCEYQQRK